MMNTFISAIVPVYNVENYLRECLDSIANQTVPFDEVILVNDGSTDNSLKICEEYCKRYSYFKLLSQNNMGLSEARNVGIKVSMGEYIVFIDSDDYVRNDMVFQLLEVMNDKDYDVLFYNADIRYDEEGGEPNGYFVRGGQFYDRDMRGIDYLIESFPGNYIVSACVAAYRRQFIVGNNIYFQKGMYFEDNAFCLLVYIMAEKVKCIGQALYIRRYHSGTISADKKGYRKLIDLIKMNKIMWDILVQANLDVRFTIRLVSYYFMHTWDIISESDYYGAVSDQWNWLLAIFHDLWLGEYQSKNLSFEEMASLLLYYKGLKRDEDIETIGRRFETEVIRRLKLIPLGNPNDKVGIYGIGRHTEKLLALYKKYVGEIKSDVFFVVSRKKSEVKNYKKYMLITCEEIPLDTNYVVISSLVYQEDMCKELGQQKFDNGKIITLYNRDDFCDVILTEKLLNYRDAIKK